MKVVFSARARHHVEAIFRYLAGENPAAAREVVAAIQDLASRLEDYPRLGHPTGIPRVHVLTVPRLPYRISYELRPDDIRILTVRHTSRRPLSRL